MNTENMFPIDLGEDVENIILRMKHEIEYENVMNQLKETLLCKCEFCGDLFDYDDITQIIDSNNNYKLLNCCEDCSVDHSFYFLNYSYVKSYFDDYDMELECCHCNEEYNCDEVYFCKYKNDVLCQHCIECWWL